LLPEISSPKLNHVVPPWAEKLIEHSPHHFAVIIGQRWIRRRNWRHLSRLAGQQQAASYRAKHDVQNRFVHLLCWTLVRQKRSALERRRNPRFSRGEPVVAQANYGRVGALQPSEA
jgi:hypothetical protein